MLRRLFIALLIACLAVPALASVGGGASAGTGHCAPAAPLKMAMAMQAGHHVHDRAPKPPAIPAEHLCIGCIAAMPAIAAPVAPVALPAIVPHRSGQVQLTGLSRAPGTPPPRA